MASVGCLRALYPHTNYKPGKEKNFVAFYSEIVLDSCVARPLDIINGKLVIRTYNEISCSGIQVQLDATINLKFDKKVDGRMSSHSDIQGLFKGSGDPESYGHFISSPVKQQLMKEPDNKAGIIPPGEHTYPFSLIMPDEPLPSPSHTQYGNIQYKVVVYMYSNWGYWVQICEEPLRFRGYNNLSQFPHANAKEIDPMRFRTENSFQKSIFSSEKVITAVLNISVRKVGFLPGEEIPFTLKINNGKSLVVRNIEVNLSKRVVYNIGADATKSTIVKLDCFEDFELRKEQEIEYKGRLKVPKNCTPSFSEKFCYSVVHLVQHEVKVTGYSGPLKGQIEIIIGTTREPIERILSRRTSRLKLKDGFGGAGAGEGAGVGVIGCENKSDGKAAAESKPGDKCQSCKSDDDSSSSVTYLVDLAEAVSLPPDYSELEDLLVTADSRAESLNSLTSLETLPPHYAELASVFQQLDN